MSKFAEKHLGSAIAAIDAMSKRVELEDALSEIEDIACTIQEKLNKLAATEKRKSVHREKKIAQRGDLDKLKQHFARYDKDTDDKLDFFEFYHILKQGDSAFDEDAAAKLFDKCDQDGSGGVDFNEFIDYVFHNKEFDELACAELSNVREEDAKELCLAFDLKIRQMIVKQLKEDGREWCQLSWQERLEECRQYEKPTLQHRKTVAALPPVSFADSEPAAAPKAKQVQRAQTTSQVAEAAPAAPKAAAAPAKKKHPMEDYTQPQLVDYSIHQADIKFVPNERHQQTLQGFKDHLKVAGSPLEIADIPKYVAKGTAGWVFVADMKTGQKAAMKTIRMTQARTGMREWFVSKICRDAGIQNIVYTKEEVRVLHRPAAPAVIGDQLANAGPVQFYLCLFQDFMPYGDLEGLQEKGKLTDYMMFHALKDMASTLAEMHAINVQHKDVKPENALVVMDGDRLETAKLCDLGSSEVGNVKANYEDDIRRFGITMYALVTGENWMKCKLLKQKHEDLQQRLDEAVGTRSHAVKQLPQLFSQIVNQRMTMAQIATKMGEFMEMCK